MAQEDFERHPAVEPRLAGEVHLAHSARAQKAFDGVIPEVFTNERFMRGQVRIPRESLRRHLHRGALHEPGRLRLRPEQAQHFAPQGGVFRRRPHDEFFALALRQVEGRVEQCVNLFSTVPRSIVLGLTQLSVQPRLGFVPLAHHGDGGDADDLRRLFDR